MDSVTDVKHEGWGSRILESIKGVLVGLLLFVVSFPVLFLNEGRAVHRARDLEEGRGAVVEANAAAVDPSQEGKLVHLTGEATAQGALQDAELGPTAPGALRLRRVVEMFQWQEERRSNTSSNTGGSQTTTTTTTYRTGWSSTAVNSGDFRVPAGHMNPPMPMQSLDLDAQRITVGARTLTPALVAQLTEFRPLPVAPAQAPGLANLGRPVSAVEGNLYVGSTAASPAVGDLRVHWELVPAGPVSILAAQQGPTFADWRTPSGRELEQNLEAGVKTADAMFGSLETGNAVITWVLRFVGWLLMFLGVLMVTRPLVVVADVLPFLGSLVGAGAGLAAFTVASPLSLLTVGVAWVVYRPLLGVLLLAAGVGVAVLSGRLAASRNAQRLAARA